jgi:uncharacterized protein YprB with RNaseH-like and TPR domain
MIDDSLRSRLEALNRGPMPAQTAIQRPAGEVAPATGPPSPRPHTQPAPVRPRPTPQTTKPTPGLLRSGDEVETASGPHLRIRLPIENFWPNGGQLISARQQFLQMQLAAAQQAIEPKISLEPEFATFISALPDGAVGLDLETCGLAGSALFLIGLIRQIEGQFTVELLLARNYAEEAAVLETLWQTIAGHSVLLTFNDKSFDWPMVVERSIRHRLPVGWAPPTNSFSSMTSSNSVGDAHPTRLHIDILHHARRRWRRHLPNCRLQTLEQHVCRRLRVDDVPGHLIPGVYADFVRTGFEREMDSVLHHNALDLVTLFDLALRLAA